MKRKSKFEDAPSTNSAVQILNKPVSAISITLSQPDGYIGFVPPQYQANDFSDIKLKNSQPMAMTYQPERKEMPQITEQEHYQQIWGEYKKTVGSAPSYSSHSSYLQSQQDPNFKYTQSGVPIPPPPPSSFVASNPYIAYQPQPSQYNPGPIINQSVNVLNLPPPPPQEMPCSNPETRGRRIKSRWSSAT